MFGRLIPKAYTPGPDPVSVSEQGLIGSVQSALLNVEKDEGMPVACTANPVKATTPAVSCAVLLAPTCTPLEKTVVPV